MLHISCNKIICPTVTSTMVAIIKFHVPGDSTSGPARSHSPDDPRYSTSITIECDTMRTVDHMDTFTCLVLYCMHVLHTLAWILHLTFYWKGSFGVKYDQILDGHGQHDVLILAMRLRWTSPWSELLVCVIKFTSISDMPHFALIHVLQHTE